MESEHKAKIAGLYRHIDLPTIEILNIADEYEFMEEELVEMLTDRMNETLRIIFKR